MTTTCRRLLLGPGLVALALAGCAPDELSIAKQAVAISVSAAVKALPTAAPPATGIPLEAIVTFPAGTLPKLRANLRTQQAVDPGELAVSDLQRLIVQANALILKPGQLTFSDLRWGPDRALIATLRLTGLPAVERLVLTLTTPRRDIALRCVVRFPQYVGRVQLNAESTARALIAEVRSGSGAPMSPDQVEPALAGALAEHLSRVMAATHLTDDLLASNNTTTVLDRIETGQAALPGLRRTIGDPVSPAPTPTPRSGNTP